MNRKMFVTYENMILNVAGLMESAPDTGDSEANEGKGE